MVVFAGVMDEIRSFVVVSSPLQVSPQGGFSVPADRVLSLELMGGRPSSFCPDPLTGSNGNRL